MKIIRLIVLSTLFLCTITTEKLTAQDIYISGLVQDINTHAGVPGVNIFIRTTNFGTTTDISGSFVLRFSNVEDDKKVVFQHVAYNVLEVSLDSLKKMKTFFLQPRIIPLQGVAVEEQSDRKIEIAKDIPQAISIIQAHNFEMRGFVDAGDLLRTDHSIQVDEELSGKKTIAIRGGNPDEVVVMYNGIKMNSTYDNIFDFSLIDLEDVSRVEIIRGSNTALYGPEAFSGVVNIVPKLKQDYNIRFHQRIGTYRSGNWGLHLFQDIGNFQGNISYKKGAYKRSFVDTEESDGLLINTSDHYNVNLNYDLSAPKADGATNSIGAMWIRSKLDYDNNRDFEQLMNENDLYSLKYHGDISFVKDLDLTTSFRRLQEDQTFLVLANDFERQIKDEALFIKAEKRQKLGLLNLLFSYDYQNSKLDFTDWHTYITSTPGASESSELKRQHHGLVSIIKFNVGNESAFINSTDLDFSIRHDRVKDSQSEQLEEDPDIIDKDRTISYFGDNEWSKTTFKFSLNLSGYREDLAFNGYMNFGRNIKFPTLFQQIGLPYESSTRENTPELAPEKNTSIEIGMELTKELNENLKIYGWQISGNYFLNNYDNKFRSFTSPNIPIATYDNVQTARISGVETKSRLFMFRKKITFELGLSKYSISEKAAFPFKSDFNSTFNVIFDHAGWSFQAHIFRESEQTGWLRLPLGSAEIEEGFYTPFIEVTLPKYSNIDIHLNKKFKLFGLKYFMNFSGRNLLDDDVVLQGLAIRDRRFYVTFGLQY